MMGALVACQKPHSSTPVGGARDHIEQKNTAEPVAGTDAVEFKEGHGIALHPKIKKNIDLKVAEVSEVPVAAEFSIPLYITKEAEGIQQVAFEPGRESRSEASGGISKEKAAQLQPGQEVQLRVDLLGSNPTAKGIVKRVETTASPALGDYEVVVETNSPFPRGTRLEGIFHLPAGDAVTAVPRSALLKTVEGWFVYAVNEAFYLRTPVKLGATSGEVAEITDGLYAGDQIVVSPVNDLWMAELQILRGGKSCTCGH